MLVLFLGTEVVKVKKMFSSKSENCIFRMDYLPNYILKKELLHLYLYYFLILASYE